MSADNGIYILESEGPEWRVVTAQAIENINWNETTRQVENGHFNMIEVKQYFGGCKVFKTFEDAKNEAFRIEEAIAKSDFPVLEYGICIIRMPFPFP